MTSRIKSKSTLKTGTAFVAALMATTMLTGAVTVTLPAIAKQQSGVVKTNLPGSFSDLIAETRPAVVSVIVEKDALKANVTTSEIPDQFKEFFERFGKNFKTPTPPHGRSATGQGSGFFISRDGYIVTNNHVIDGAKEIKVRLADKRLLKAKLVGSDPKTDLAVLKVEGDNFKHVTFGNSDTTKVGDWVIALGNPFGLTGTATAGIVSARARDIGAGPYDEFLQIDAPINKGNSGGPAFNRRGEVIGVNTAIFSPSGGNVGIGFAVPSNIASGVIDSLIKYGKVNRGWLGVMIQPVTTDLADSLGLKSEDGALISMVTEKSPAGEAGIKAGDVVTAVGDQVVKSPRDLAKAIGNAGANKTVKLKIVRDGKQRSMEVALKQLKKKEVAAAAESQAQKGKAKLGLMVKETEQGVVVTKVLPDSPAAAKGLRSGDVIALASGKKVRSVQDLHAALKSANDNPVLLLVKNKKGARFVALKPSKSIG